MALAITIRIMFAADMSVRVSSIIAVAIIETIHVITEARATIVTAIITVIATGIVQTARLTASLIAHGHHDRIVRHQAMTGQVVQIPATPRLSSKSSVDRTTKTKTPAGFGGCFVLKEPLSELDDIFLAGGLDDFPASLETSPDNKIVSGFDFAGFAILFSYDRPA